MPEVLPNLPFTLAASAPTAEAYPLVSYSSSSAQSSTIPDTNSGWRIEVLEQTIYDRGLASEYHIPDIMFHDFRLRDALKKDFRFLADPEGAAWPESVQAPQKLAIVLCFDGYGKHSRQVNVLRHMQGHTLPPTRSKVAHIVASFIDAFLIETRDPAKAGPLSYRGRQLTLDDLVLIDVHHASQGSLQPTIGIIDRA
ncbi:hypothetical protein L227DRAFT_658358 [Lentinus tigrinus ALCF2SS1-6]|uniref:Uncharacterized protein n=1 Tax=Lentinus tigrinus ALCF2SS1-6 TaxID=1328759 RepID=A0A5C2RNI8_9APHY|nr:hypothetical protein L227DRAFT_658358 [Lentinus tigrinus ALCF2SS1-6]